MKCPTCGADNRDGAKYCQSCRTLLAEAPVIAPTGAPVEQLLKRRSVKTTTSKLDTHPMPTPHRGAGGDRAA